MIMWRPVEGRPFEGDRLGRYRLVAELGHGGMGTIHLALTSGLGEFRKLLVVKELQRDLALNDKFIEMFMSEAKLAARLSHPNIVQTVEAGEEDGRYFIAMEFLDGQPLTEVLKRQTVEPVVSLGMRLQILCDVLSGLTYAHELCDFDGSPYEIVHRDVNPHNVFVTYHGQVKLVDFGIAKAVDIESLTTAGVFKGKFAYAAPEQVRSEAVDQRSDLFAVGVMLWEAIANRRFAPGLPTRLSLDRRLQGLEPRIREVAPEIDPALAEISDRALAVDKRDRYATAQEFRTALQRYLLVAGETPTESLGALMCSKFAAERAAMHSMIDAATKRDERYQSVIRSLNAEPAAQPATPHPVTATPARPPRSEGPTLVGDLRRLADPSGADNPLTGISQPSAATDTPVVEVPAVGEATQEWATRLRGRHGPYPWLALALTVGMGGLLWLGPARSPTPAPSSTPAPSPKAAEPETRIQPATAPAVPALPPQEVSPPPSAATTPEPVPSRPARVWRPRSAVANDGGSTRTRGAAGDRAPRTGGPAGAPSTEQLGSAPRSAPAMIGQDLRELPRRKQRPIDLDDPYQ